jgi:hypothetical protein
MARHLREEALLDALEGGLDPSAQEHLASCATCAAALAEASEGLRLAGRSLVPERPEGYWQGFDRRLRDRVEAGARGEMLWGWLRPSWIAAAAVVAALSVTPQRGALVGDRVAPVLPAWSALPSVEEDSGLAILEAFSSESDGVIEPEIAMCGQTAECLAGLTDEENDAVAKAFGEAAGSPRRDL